MLSYLLYFVFLGYQHMGLKSQYLWSCMPQTSIYNTLYDINLTLRYLAFHVVWNIQFPCRVSFIVLEENEWFHGVFRFLKESSFNLVSLTTFFIGLLCYTVCNTKSFVDCQMIDKIWALHSIHSISQNEHARNCYTLKYSK